MMIVLRLRDMRIIAFDVDQYDQRVALDGTLQYCVVLGSAAFNPMLHVFAATAFQTLMYEHEGEPPQIIASYLKSSLQTYLTHPSPLRDPEQAINSLVPGETVIYLVLSEDGMSFESIELADTVLQ